MFQFFNSFSCLFILFEKLMNLSHLCFISQIVINGSKTTLAEKLILVKKKD